jgi:hypothetical protein
LLALVLVAVLLSGACNRDVHSAPRAPDDVCPLIGTDLLERAVPGHEEAGLFRDPDGDSGNSRTCRVRTPGSEPSPGDEVTSPYRILAVTVTHVPPGYFKSAETEAKEDLESRCERAQDPIDVDREKTCYGLVKQQDGYRQWFTVAREGSDWVLANYELFGPATEDPRDLLETIRDEAMANFRDLPTESPT